MDSEAWTFCACTKYIMKNDTTNTSHSVSKMGGNKPETMDWNTTASSEQYQLRNPRRPEGGSTLHAMEMPTVNMPDGKRMSSMIIGMMKNTRRMLWFRR